MSDTKAVMIGEPREDDGLALVPTFVMTLDQAARQLLELQQFVKRILAEGEDYGTIPGTPKPTLYKSGAEKLCNIYGLTPLVAVEQRIEDWEQGVFAYEVKVTLQSRRSGLVVAEGLGSCNSKEKRYQRQDAFTIVNTILKMAKKRAFVDATLSATRASAIFTQDVEDMHDAATRPGQPSQTPPGPRDQAGNFAPPSQGSATDAQRRAIFAIGRDKHKLSEDEIGAHARAFCGHGVSEMTKKQASDFISLMQAGPLPDLPETAATVVEGEVVQGEAEF